MQKLVSLRQLLFMWLLFKQYILSKVSGFFIIKLFIVTRKIYIKMSHELSYQRIKTANEARISVSNKQLYYRIFYLYLVVRRED